MANETLANLIKDGLAAYGSSGDTEHKSYEFLSGYLVDNGVSVPSDKHKYLFILSDETLFFTETAETFAMAINQLAVYTGTHTPLFAKAMKGMTSNKDMIELFNHFAYHGLQHVYEVQCALYEDGKYGEDN